MRILVTGGCGFIGSNFIRYILRKYPDYRILNLDKLTYAGNLENLADIKNDSRYQFIQGDIAEAKIVNKLVKEVDTIVNFAAETHVDRSILSPDAFVKTDIYGCYNLLEAVKKYKIKKFCHISTDETYGSILRGAFTEQSPLKPNSPYSAAKAGADLLVHSYFVTYGLPVVTVRPSNNFGPYQYPEKVIPLFITNALENKPLPLYGKGKNIRDWLYVEDNCRAIDLVLQRGVVGETYNVGGGNELTNRQLTEQILDILRKPSNLIQYVTDRPGHDFRYALDSRKIEKELGWQPKYSFEQALRKTVKWYIGNKDWWKRIKTRPEYKNFYSRQYK